MQRAKDRIPWKVTDISFRPYSHFWSFNPSIHFDGKLWRCSLRCADYCMKDGKTTRSAKAVPGESRTKNAMVIFDPVSWKPVEIYKMREHDGLRRVPCSSLGFEDIRLFKTGAGKLHGIAASLHLWRGDRDRNRFAEQVLLSFDTEYHITQALPLRGSSWDDQPQKNWVPFDNCVEPRFLYSIGEGKLFDGRGPVGSKDLGARAAPLSPILSGPGARARDHARKRAEESLKARKEDETRALKAGARVDLSASLLTYKDLRGGTQLVHIGDKGWLGIGHKMTFVDHKKFYWHVWYLVDEKGQLLAVSDPMKLASNGIEFAAGLGIDGDRVVVSFGVDDMECKIGETKLPAVLDQLRPLKLRA